MRRDGRPEPPLLHGNDTRTYITSESIVLSESRVDSVPLSKNRSAYYDAHSANPTLARIPSPSQSSYSGETHRTDARTHGSLLVS